MSVRFVRAEPGHALQVAPELREADSLELAAAVDVPAALAIGWGVQNSEKSWVAFCGEDLIAIFGVVRVAPGHGRPWMHGTRALEKHPKAFLAASRAALGMITAEFPKLSNWVHAENDAALRWLAWLGFGIADGDPDVLGPYGEPFRLFWMHATEGH